MIAQFNRTFFVAVVFNSCLAVFLFAASPLVTYGQADFSFNGLAPAVGSADKYGYAYKVIRLGEFNVDETVIPLDMVFTTDPRLRPGPLGRGWDMPFFSSSLVEVSQSSIRWHRPDSRIFFFARQRDQEAATRNRDEQFKSMGGAWSAVRDKNRRIVLTHAKSGAELVYEEGLLVQLNFSGAKSTVKNYYLKYNSSRQPEGLWPVGSASPLVKFTYGDDRLASSIQINGQVLKFEYGGAALNKFSVGPYLIGFSSGPTKYLDLSYRSEGPDLNMITFKSFPLTRQTNLCWIAKSGFLKTDDDASYLIENPSLENEGRSSIGKPEAPGKAAIKNIDYNWNPDEAKITRIDSEGAKEFRHYDQARGIFTRIGEDGKTTKIYYLLTPGPALNKIRKVEEISNNKTVTVERNAFDELGRHIRKIGRNGDIVIWEYAPNGDYKVIENGRLKEEVFMKSGETIKKVMYTPTGIRTFLYENSSENKKVTLLEDGAVTNFWVYDFSGKLVDSLSIKTLQALKDISKSQTIEIK